MSDQRCEHEWEGWVNNDKGRKSRTCSACGVVEAIEEPTKTADSPAVRAMKRLLPKSSPDGYLPMVVSGLMPPRTSPPPSRPFTIHED
ncbi:MAG: hypothetical protein K9G59_18940 [Caulobacter sp.]|nr:hypothetical protein [Caulobacter sp.]